MGGETKRKTPDWEAIEREYRAGSLSVRQIAANHGVSHTAIQKRAASGGWEQDLTEKVQKAVARKVVASAVATIPSREKVATEREIIAAAADRGASAVHGHLARAARLARIAERNLECLEALQAGQPLPFNFQTGKGDCTTTLIKTTADLIERSANMERKALNLDDNKDADRAVSIEVVTGIERKES